MSIALAIGMSTPATADDELATAAVSHGRCVDATLSLGGRLGPVPSEVMFWRLDAGVGRTFWRRLHVGLEVGGGAGGNAEWFAHAMVAAGAWLHPSDRVDLLIEYRVGRARFSIHEVPISATAAEFVVDLRFRVRDRVAVRFAPLVVSGYWSDLWNIMVGPELGAVVEF